ncbi:MAG: polysaccharide biosynthesis/export family protein [Acidobacteriota bacterium]|nr:MAG: polysaccharide biosynthesis/export family protein [Acidobacteriota bacterium]
MFLQRRRTCAGVIAFVVFLVSCASGKTPRMPDPPNTAEELRDVYTPRQYEERISPIELVRQFDSEAGEVYLLGEGDEVNIEVWSHPELTGRHSVGPDGQITLPVAGAVHLAGLSREEAQNAVNDAFGRYYTDLQITVQVSVYASNNVLILGRVTSPGIVPFSTPPTLLEAIALAGGLPVGGIGADKAALTRCAVFRGRERVLWIELSRLLSGQDLSLNIRLRKNDIVYVPDADDRMVYLMGEVERPGAYNLKQNMSLLEALNVAGGATRDAQDRVMLVRADLNTSIEIGFEELLTSPAARNYVLNEGDIIYLPQKGMAKLGYVLEKLSPLTGIMLVGSAIVR